MIEARIPFGKTAADCYAEREQKLTKQPTKIDWGVIDEIDYEVVDDEDRTKGESFSDTISCFVYPSMRIGFLLQTISMLLILCVHHGHGATNAFTFDLYNFSDRLRASAAFTLSIVTLLAVYGCGVFSLLFWQAFAADNSKFSRGFRAGSKLFSAALTLDLLVLGFRLLAFVYGYHFMEKRWWLHYAQTSTDFSLFYFSALIHGIALILYGVGIFYMEGYHDEGTYEEFAWINFVLFSLAGLSEILMVLTGWGACFSFIQLAACAFALLWSLSFEPTIQYHACALHDRNVNDEVVAPQVYDLEAQQD